MQKEIKRLINGARLSFKQSESKLNYFSTEEGMLNATEIAICNLSEF